MLKSKLKKFIAASLIVLTSLSFFSSTSFAYDANSKADRYFGGNLTAGINRPAWYHSSVASYGYTSHFDSARAYWNNNTPVNIWKWDQANNSTDRYYVGTTYQGAGNLNITGAQGAYKVVNGVAVSATNNENWNYSTVTIYHNAMASKNYDRGKANATAAHEVGHSIKFAHTPLNWLGQEYVDSVMRSDDYSMKAITTSYDLDTVHQKWGY